VRKSGTKLITYDILLTINLRNIANNYLCRVSRFYAYFKAYIFSNVHVAIAGYCLTKITLLQYGFDTYISPLFVLFSIIFSYNFIRYLELETHEIDWFKEWYDQHKIGFFVLSVSALVGLVILVFSSSISIGSLLVLLPFLLPTFFYVIPLCKRRGVTFSFRDFPGVKIYSIALCWAGVTVFFPLLAVGFQLDSGVWWLFIQRVLILIVITIPFDIRDVKKDPPSLRTLPQLIGVGKSKGLALLLLCFFLLLSLYRGDSLSGSVDADFLVAGITAFFVLFSSPKKSRYYTSFWVESIPVYWLMILSVLP